jgi:transcriptional regulator of NAD metabolism
MKRRLRRRNMKGEERRSKILSMLKNGQRPLKGGELSEVFDVSRQVIVQDIALLRAEGNDIIATPQGYMLLDSTTGAVKKVVAVKHDEENIADELTTIVNMGGRILDVTIEHKIYGEITGKLMLKSLFDVEQFMKKLKEEGVKPLSNLTEGVHIHTIEAEDTQVMDRIIQALKDKGYLVT